MDDDAQLLKALEVLSDGGLPFRVIALSGASRGYAVSKVGTVTLVRLFASKDDAEAFCRTMNFGEYLKRKRDAGDE